MIRKQLFAVLSALLLLAAGFAVPLAQAQQGSASGSPLIPLNVNRQHWSAGVYVAPNYNTYQAYTISGNGCAVNAGTNTCTGGPVSGSIVVFAQGVSGMVTLGDGAAIPLATVFNTNTPIQINDSAAPAGSLPEIVTPSSVSIGFCPAGFLGVGSSNQCATITASFLYSHGGGAIIISGDAGIQEAITDAGNNGGGLVFWMVNTGIVTLNTGSLTTTTTTKVPTNFYNLGASARVTTTITTTTNWAVGISGATSIFCSANTTLTAGTTCLANQAAPASTGTTSALTAVLFTFTVANPGAGAIKAQVWGYTPVQASS